jgi:hypothetical protein
MDINTLILLHGSMTFKVDAEDESGVFMHIDGYRLHVRRDDVSLAQGLSMSEFHPLIDSFIKV